MTIQEKAKKLSSLFQYKKFDNGIERVICTADVNSPEWNECMDLLYTVEKNTCLGMDSRYRFTSMTLDAIVEMPDNLDTDSIGDELYSGSYLEPDIYTGDLTEWLNESNYHVEYLTEALTDFSPSDGFQLLAMAQGKAIEKTAQCVLDWLIDNTK